MSTIWNGVCLSHDPPIEFEMSDGRYEIKNPTNAVACFRRGDSGHVNCDVVLGGYSYPIVAVACPCSKHREGTPAKVWDATELRLVLDVARSLDTMTGSASLDEWMRHNNCWTVERLEKLAPLFHPKPDVPEAARPGSLNALTAAIKGAGWEWHSSTIASHYGEPSVWDLRVYPVPTSTDNEGK